MEDSTEENSNKRTSQFAAEQSEALFCPQPAAKRCKGCDELRKSYETERKSRMAVEEKYNQLLLSCDADTQRKLEELKARVLADFREYVRLKQIETDENMDNVKAAFAKELESKDKDYKCLLKVAVRELCLLQSQLEESGKEDTRLRQYLHELQRNVETMDIGEEEVDEIQCDCNTESDETDELTTSENDEFERLELLQIHEQQHLQLRQKQELDKQVLVQGQRQRRLRKRQQKSPSAR